MTPLIVGLGCGAIHVQLLLSGWVNELQAELTWLCAAAAVAAVLGFALKGGPRLSLLIAGAVGLSTGVSWLPALLLLNDRKVPGLVGDAPTWLVFGFLEWGGIEILLGLLAFLIATSKSRDASENCPSP